MNLSLLVHGGEAVQVGRRVGGRLQGGVEQGQQRRRQLLAHLPGAEVGVGPLVGVVAPGKLGEGPGGADAGVVGVEGGVDDQVAVVHQTGIVDGLEGAVIHPFGGQVQEHLTERQRGQIRDR